MSILERYEQERDKSTFTRELRLEAQSGNEYAVFEYYTLKKRLAQGMYIDELARQYDIEAKLNDSYALGNVAEILSNSLAYLSSMASTLYRELRVELAKKAAAKADKSSKYAEYYDLRYDFDLAIENILRASTLWKNIKLGRGMLRKRIARNALIQVYSKKPNWMKERHGIAEFDVLNLYYSSMHNLGIDSETSDAILRLFVDVCQNSINQLYSIVWSIERELTGQNREARLMRRKFLSAMRKVHN